MKINFWLGTYTRERAYSRGLFKVWYFPQRHTNKQHNFLNQLNLSNFSARAFLKEDIIGQLCFPQIRPYGVLLNGGLLGNVISYVGLFEGGLFKEGHLS